jgi:hypothetical protein
VLAESTGIAPVSNRPLVRLRKPQLIGLALILLLAAILRVHGIGIAALTVDELGSMETAAGRGQIHLNLPRDVLLTPPPPVTHLKGGGSIAAVPQLMTADVHPPLYFLLLRIWQDLFGDSDVASRMLSAVTGVAGVALIFDVGRLLGDAGVGLWAALLMALAQPEIIYSREARPYALLAAAALAAADALVRIVKLGPNRRRRLALFTCLVAACLTHYFVLPAIVAMLVYALVRLRGSIRQEVLICFLAAGGAVLVFWGHGLWMQRANFSDPWMYWFRDDLPDHISQTWRRFAALPLRYLAEPSNRSGAAILGGIVLYLLPWLLVRRKPAILLPAMWLLGCAMLITLLDLSRQTNQLAWIKYSLLAGPAVYLIIPMLLNARLKHVLPLAAAIYCAIATPQIYEDARNGAKGDFKTLAADLGNRTKPDDVILFAGAGWGDWYTGTLYMGVERYAKRMPQSVVLLKNIVSPELSNLLQYRRCWLVMSYTSQTPRLFLPNWQARKLNVYPGVAILYELTAPRPINEDKRTLPSG